MTAYPAIAPSSRSYQAGDWPVKTFNAQDGAEVRILYGDKRFGHTLDLTYQNIPDTQAEEFMLHYFSVQGTYQTFALPTSSGVAKGWEGNLSFYNAGYLTQWRYAGPPVLTSVRPGVSTVEIRFIAVLLAS